MPTNMASCTATSSPATLLLDTQETVWVADFGLAKLEDQQNLTQSGDILGTLRYMPPEAIDGKSDKRSDVYGLGLTLYEMLAMRPAFGERERHRLIKQITTAEPESLTRVNPAIPRDLATIVHKASEREAKDRYATAGELAADLRRFLDDAPIQARRIGTLERLYRWCRRNRAVAGLAGTVLLLITTLAIVSTIGTIRLAKALSDRGFALSERSFALDEARRANAEANAKLWDSLVSQARASRITRQSGQRLGTLRAIRKALELPVPPGRSKDELRTEAIGALVLPDIEIAKELPEGFPIGTTALVMDPTFERYARADKDGNVSIYQVADDRLLYKLPGVGASFDNGGVQFSPDGRFLYHQCGTKGTGSRSHSRVWRLDARGPVEVDLADHGSIRCSFEPAGNRCALAYPDQTIRFVDLATLKVTTTTTRHRSPADVYLAWCPRRPLLAVGATNSEICQLIDVDSGVVRGELRIPGYVIWLDWHPDGEILAAATIDRKIHLLDSRSGREVMPPLEGYLNGGVVCRFSHRGDWLVSNDWSGILRVWDARTGGRLLTQAGGTPFPQFSLDDRLVGPVCSGSVVRLMRSVQCTALRTLRASAGYGYRGSAGLSWIDGRDSWLAVMAEDNRGVILIDTARGCQAAVIPLPGNAPLRFDRQEHALWTYGRLGLLRWPTRRDGSGGGEIRVGPPERLSRALGAKRWGANDDGSIVAIPTFDGASVWQRSKDRVVRVGQRQTDVRNCAVSPDGRWVVTGSHSLREGGGARVWDADSGRQVADLAVSGLCDVCFSPTGKWLLTTGGGPRLWEVGTWREGPKIANSADNVWHCFAADDKLLALGDEPGVVRLVSPATGRELARLTISEAGRLMPACFTAHGRRLAVSCDTNSELYLFDLAALRIDLRELGLDWDDSPLPPTSDDPIEPMHVTVDLGIFKRSAEADKLVEKAAELGQAKKYGEALAALREAIHADPNHAHANNNLAWLLVTGPKELRDAREALPLARKAAEQKPQTATYLNTLGVVLYRSGKYAEAISVLEKSLAAGRGSSDAFDLYFLAMCDHQLGEATKAKECYERAAKWVNDQREIPAQWAADLIAFQAEADDLLAHARPPSHKD
jgi:WD40 repeat protein/Tfp pilus assembly protein PilF